MPIRRPLLALIAAEVISSLGSLMTVVALPWFVLETTGSPLRMSIVLAAESAALLLVGIPSSRLVARIGSRRALILCDAVWAPVTALVPVLHFAGALSFPLLVVLAFVAGSLGRRIRVRRAWSCRTCSARTPDGSRRPMPCCRR